jgi:DNA-binding response OmpR family regulator
MSGGGRIGHRNYLDGVLELGVDDVLEKPFGMDDLLNCIERQLG